MKKLFAAALAAALLLLSACSSGGASQPQSAESQSSSSAASDAPASQSVADSSEAPAETDSRILVAYFTMPEPTGVDAVAGASRVVVDGELMGNTQYLANIISKDTGGELFAIETVQTYPANHDELTEHADTEQAQDARPELATHIESPDDYDVIFIGYPNWWADLPMPLYTFLEEYDFAGKTLVPFNTHGGSRFSGTIDTMKRLQPGATVVEDGFTVARNDVADAEGDILAWLDGLELI